MKTHLEWQFGGCLQSLSPALAWGILAAVTIGGLSLIVFLYRRTLRDLLPVARRVLTGLRVLLLLTILLVLANPSRVAEPQRAEKEAVHSLHVLVDRSASMESVDNRNQSRLANALRIWKEHTGDAEKNFAHLDYRRFSVGTEEANSLESAAGAAKPGEQTLLWKAIQQALADSPEGVVCLTDGLDTTGEGRNEAIAEAQQRGVPLYFVPGSNRSRPVEVLSIRDVKTPSRVLRQSKFTASAILEISSSSDRNVPVELWSATRCLASGTVNARRGWNVVPWSVDVMAGEPGALPLEFRLGTSGSQEIAASTTQVVPHTQIEVLYYQGALQWGFRYLRTALESDPSFNMTSILNPALGVRLNIAAAQSTLPDLPDTREALKKYQIVVLANAFADQLTTRQQQALIDYVKAGGGVLFIAPDDESTSQFSGTLLEEMLPVVFERTQPTREELAARQFRESMESSAAESEDIDMAGLRNRRQAIPELIPMKLPQAAGGLLKPGQSPPLFANYARVRRIKAGAQVLAVHPREITPDRNARPLLTRQQFGAGFSAAMTTDLLWRWKMSLPNQSRAVETFWQQLMLSLAPATGDGLRIVKPASTLALNRITRISVTGCSGAGAPTLVAVSPAGQQQSLGVAASPEGWAAPFTPTSEGRWQIQATDVAGNRARITLPVSQEQRTAENSNIPSDVDGMREAAEATGGALIGPGFTFQKNEPLRSTGEKEKIGQPIWSQPWMIGMLLGVYATELIARRRFKLL